MSLAPFVVPSITMRLVCGLNPLNAGQSSDQAADWPAHDRRAAGRGDRSG